MTTPRRPRPRHHGLTLIELMVVVALLGVLLALGAPSLFDYIRVQRLKSISAQLGTDVQFARSQAVAHGLRSFVLFPAAGSAVSCYTIYELRPTGDATKLYCDCTKGPGQACTNPVSVELRTVTLPSDGGVQIQLPAGDRGFGFDPVTGGLLSHPNDMLPKPLDAFVVNTVLDSARALRTTVGRAGRPTVCSTQAALGMQPC